MRACFGRKSVFSIFLGGNPRVLGFGAVGPSFRKNIKGFLENRVGRLPVSVGFRKSLEVSGFQKGVVGVRF